MDETDSLQIFKNNFERACRKLRSSAEVGKDVRFTPGESRALILALGTLSKKEEPEAGE